MPRFTLPVSVPGRPFTSIAIAPAADGSFTTRVPLGQIQVGAPTGLPSGIVVKSLLLGTVDLLKEGVTVTATDARELRITLGR